MTDHLQIRAINTIRFLSADVVQQANSGHPRNMANTSLLRELGRARMPVLLKRGLAATIDEWLNAAEYIISAGNPRVILCERGSAPSKPPHGTRWT